MSFFKQLRRFTWCSLTPARLFAWGLRRLFQTIFFGLLWLLRLFDFFFWGLLVFMLAFIMLWLQSCAREGLGEPRGGLGGTNPLPLEYFVGCGTCEFFCIFCIFCTCCMHGCVWPSRCMYGFGVVQVLRSTCRAVSLSTGVLLFVCPDCKFHNKFLHYQ